MKRLSSEAWESVMAAHAAMMRCFEADGNWKTMSVREYDVLYTLAKSGCAMSQKDLLRGVLLSQPAVSRLMDRLEKQGLIVRSRDPQDGRSVLVTLSEKGHDEWQKVGRRHLETIDRQLSAALTEEQMLTLIELMGSINKVANDEET